MYVKKGLKNILILLGVTIFIASSLLGIKSIGLTSAQSDEEYTYYGVVPANNYQYNLTDPDDRNSEWIPYTRYGVAVFRLGLLTITAGRDNTNVKVYNLTIDELVAQDQLNSMENLYVLLSNGTVFKVVSDQPVSVLLLNYQGMPDASATEGLLSLIVNPSTFYTSTDGLFVGREFVLMASEVPNTIVYGQAGTFYTIMALENADITVTRDDGDQTTFSLAVNAYRFYMLRPFRTYRFESTGSIMIQSGIINYWAGVTYGFFVPAAEGGFVGKTFYTRSIPSWDYRRDYGYRISSLEDARITVYNLETYEVLDELTVRGGIGTSIMPTAQAIAIQSDRPITLELINNGSIEQTHPLAGGAGGIYGGYTSGVTFIGIRPNEDTPIYLPVDSYIEAYFFASEETQITIDGSPYTLPADSYYHYSQPGTHTIRSDRNIVVQINWWPREPANQGNRFTGALVPSVQTVSLTPDVTLTPLGGGLPLTYIVIGVAAAAVAAIAAFFIMRRRSKKIS
jgi:hypothetical protein